MSPLFVTGDPEWGDYTVEARVRPLALGDLAGLAFRYATNRHYYFFALTGRQGGAARRAPALSRRRSAWPSSASWDAPPSPTTPGRYYHLKVENDGPRIRAYVDGRLLIEASDGELLRGKAGLVANIPARYQAFRREPLPARPRGRRRSASASGRWS